MSMEIRELTELVDGKVSILVDGERMTYTHDKIEELNKEYRIVSISAENDAVVIKLEGKDIDKPDSDFVKDYVSTYGREPNLFDGD